jgi:hypothetical protein
MKSPNGLYTVTKIDYNETRMGGPLIGRIRIAGGRAKTGEREFGEAMAFSPDSRYLAIGELVGVTRDNAGPHSQVVVFDLELGQEYVVHDEYGGLIHVVSWDVQGSLSVTAWRYPDGESEHRDVWGPSLS